MSSNCGDSFNGQLDIMNSYDLGIQIFFMIFTFVYMVHILTTLTKIRQEETHLKREKMFQDLETTKQSHKIHTFLLIYLSMTIFTKLYGIGVYESIHNNINIRTLNDLLNNNQVTIMGKFYLLFEYLYITTMNIIFLYISNIYAKKIIKQFLNRASNFSQYEIQGQTQKIKYYQAKLQIIYKILLIIYCLAFAIYLPLQLGKLKMNGYDIVAKIDFFLTIINTTIFIIVTSFFHRNIWKQKDIKKWQAAKSQIVKIILLIISQIGRIFVDFFNTTFHSTYLCQLRNFSLGDIPLQDLNTEYFGYLIFANFIMILLPTYAILKTFAPKYAKQQSYLYTRTY